eukprot:353438-Chlamydomonas_euryale.AAC.4
MSGRGPTRLASFTECQAGRQRLTLRPATKRRRAIATRNLFSRRCGLLERCRGSVAAQALPASARSCRWPGAALAQIAPSASSAGRQLPACRARGYGRGREWPGEKAAFDQPSHSISTAPLQPCQHQHIFQHILRCRTSACRTPRQPSQLPPGATFTPQFPSSTPPLSVPQGRPPAVPAPAAIADAGPPARQLRVARHLSRRLPNPQHQSRQPPRHSQVLPAGLPTRRPLRSGGARSTPACGAAPPGRPRRPPAACWSARLQWRSMPRAPGIVSVWVHACMSFPWVPRTGPCG